MNAEPDNKVPSYSTMFLPYLPNIAWFSCILQRDTILIEREENFIKSTHRNRAEIAGANGKQLLSIPVHGGRDHHQKYKETIIRNESQKSEVGNRQPAVT